MKRKVAQILEKRNFHENVKLPSEELLNMMSQSICKKIYDHEVNTKSKICHIRGCILSTRKIDPYIGYPRLQIPYEHVPPSLKYLCNDRYKGRLKVFLHQLAWRALDKIVPQYEDNIDIVHLCGQGRYSSLFEQSLKSSICCFNMEHLSTSSHKENMNSQNCKPSVQCPNCLYNFSICNHEPRCL